MLHLPLIFTKFKLSFANKATKALDLLFLWLLQRALQSMQFLIISRQNFNIEKNLQQQQQSGWDGEVNNNSDPQDSEKKAKQ